MLSIDERCEPAGLLHARDGMECERGLARGLGAVDLDDPAARQPADAEGDVKGDGTCRDDIHRSATLLAESHDRALAELALDLGEG